MKVITIGRNQANDVVVFDPSVSQYHVRLSQHDDGNIYLSALDSNNRPYVNGKEVNNEICLGKNDVLCIGNTTIPWQKYFGFECERNATIDDTGETPYRLVPDKKSVNDDVDGIFGLGPAPMIGISFALMFIGWLLGFELGLRVGTGIFVLGVMLVVLAVLKIVLKIIAKITGRNKKGND